MADTLKVDIVSAEEQMFSGEASMVIASAEMGAVGIVPGHAALITRIKPGEVEVRPEGDGEPVNIYVSGGMLEVQPYHVTVLADTALRADDIDAEAAERAKQEALEILEGNADDREDIDYAKVQMQLAEASAKLMLLQKLKRD